MDDQTIEDRIVAAIEREPGRKGLSVQYDVRRDTLASREAVARATAHLLAHSRIILDGELRLWPVD